MNKEQLIARAEELGLDVQALNAANEKGVATNAELKAAILEAESKLEPTGGTEKTPVTWQDNEGRVWKFSADAPKTINIDGRPLSQSEILEREDIISELAYGNCSFLTRKY